MKIMQIVLNTLVKLFSTLAKSPVCREYPFIIFVFSITHSIELIHINFIFKKSAKNPPPYLPNASEFILFYKVFLVLFVGGKFKKDFDCLYVSVK